VTDSSRSSAGPHRGRSAATIGPDGKPGRRYYNKSHNVSAFTTGMINTVLQFTATMSPYPSGQLFRRWSVRGRRMGLHLENEP
jgi:hypothetical protein